MPKPISSIVDKPSKTSKKTIKREKKTASIKLRIILSVTGLILFFGSVATYAVFLMSKNNLIMQGHEELTAHTEDKGNEIRGPLTFSTELVQTISAHSDIISIIESENPSEADLKHATEHYLNTYNIGDMYSAIYIMNLDGLTIASSNELFVGNNYGFREYFKEAVLNDSHTDIARGVTSKELGYYFSHSIKNAQGEVIGVAVVKMKPGTFDAIFSHAIEGNMQMFLADSYGVIVHSTDKTKIYKSLGPLSDKNMNEIKDIMRYDGIEITALDYIETQEAFFQLKDSPQLFEVLDEQDNSVSYLAAIKIADFPFYIISEVELAPLIELSVKSAIVIAEFVFLAALVAGLLIYPLVSRLLKPLKDLQKAIDHISKGNFSERITVRSNDEIGLLSVAFNKMVDEIIKTQKAVNDMVKTKTKELAEEKVAAEEMSSSMVGRELKMLELKEELAELKKNVKTNETEKFINEQT